MKNYIFTLLYFLFLGTLFGQNNGNSFAMLVEPDTRITVEVAETLVFNKVHIGQVVKLRTRGIYKKNEQILIGSGAIGKAEVTKLRPATATDAAAIILTPISIQTMDNSWLDVQPIPEVFEGFEVEDNFVEVMSGAIFRVVSQLSPAPMQADTNQINTTLGVYNSSTMDDSSFTEQRQTDGEDFSFPFDFEIAIAIDTNLQAAQIENGSTIPMFVSEEMEWENKIIFEEGAMVQGSVHHLFGTTLYILPLTIQTRTGQTISVSGPLIKCELEETDTDALFYLEAEGSCFKTKK